MAESVDYFSNHKLKLKFPWRLYHAPIIESLDAAVRDSPGPDVLNLGSGPFFELVELKHKDRRFTICDIDARAIETAKEIHGSALARADVIHPGEPLPYADASFDLVVSMDVIEHVPAPVPWVREVLRVLKPGGRMFLTTPNYASTSLRAIEATALELVARLQGFSRRDLHPTKMTRGRLEVILSAAGATDSHVEEIALGWVLAVHARKA